ncbi:tetratricopeptide repeat protein, partial [Desulfovibrio sp. OttesenSCG-928-O18]|nr:tetratricopeptide repeat protein [Desulfovibrio sp. OttesenSCG-928-O18]
RGRIEQGAVAQPVPEPTPQPAPSAPAPSAQAAPVSPSSPSQVARTNEPGVSVFRSRINRGTLADWEAMQSGKAASAPGDGTPSQTAQGSGAAPSGHGMGTSSTPAAEPVTPPVPEKIYVDEKGNPVPPPPDPVEALAEIHKDISSRKYQDALDKLTPLLVHPELTRDQTEEILHLHAEMLFMAHQDKLSENFDAITSATIAAMNYNQESPRNAGAYLRLGYINLQVGNTVEADAYFTRLRRQYPLDENIALTYYYWGNYYYDRGEMQKAADEFQYIVSNFSENKIAREASLGLARCYNALGYYQEAFDIIDYVERRWPRLYLESPPVLELMGDIAFRKGDLDFALDRYSIYYNLMPNGPKADVILSRIGDVYTLKRQLGAAKTAYSEAERLFPGKDGGLVAMMRLAEVGINDTPEIETMFSVFKGPANFKTQEIYNKIIKDHPESELVPLARLKLAMWYFVNNRYEEALAACTELVKQYPKHELVPYAEEVAMKAFSALAAEGATQNRAGQVIASWSANPIIRKQEEALSPESRVALATSMEKQNDPDGALKMLNPLFLGRKDPNFAEQGLHLALSIYLEHDMWADIEKLAEQISLWELTPPTKDKLDYALALARENQGKSVEAVPLWSRLAGTGRLAEDQQAQSEYFLAMDAKNTNRLQEAYIFGRSSLNRFLQMGKVNPEKDSTGRINSLRDMLMGVCEMSGRFDEALGYAQDYLTGLADNAPQRPSILTSMARIYHKKGDIPEWRRRLTEVRDKYPDTVYGKTAASALSSAQITQDAAQFSPGGSL